MNANLARGQRGGNAAAGRVAVMRSMPAVSRAIAGGVCYDPRPSDAPSPLHANPSRPRGRRRGGIDRERAVRRLSRARSVHRQRRRPDRPDLPAAPLHARRCRWWFAALALGVAGLGDLRSLGARRPQDARVHGRRVGDRGRHRRDARQRAEAGGGARARGARAPHGSRRGRGGGEPIERAGGAASGVDAPRAASCPTTWSRRRRRATCSR